MIKMRCGRHYDVIMSESVIQSDPAILGGTPGFCGPRVPVGALLDYLEAGQTINDFLADFPTVNREQAMAALELARTRLADDASAA